MEQILRNSNRKRKRDVPTLMSDLDTVVDRLRVGQRFIILAPGPDGDAIGSALAAALRCVPLANKPRWCSTRACFLQPFPGVDRLRVASRVDHTCDAALIMEVRRSRWTGVAGLERSPVLNIGDHHLGNTRYGQVNWVDESAAACGNWSSRWSSDSARR